jgi:anthranilate synthase
MQQQSYMTKGGVRITREIRPLPYEGASEPLIDKLDSQRGLLFSSSFDFPGRYTRWDIGFADPPLALTARGRRFAIEALSARGEVLIAAILPALGRLSECRILAAEAQSITGDIPPPRGRFPEELRSRQASIFSVLRALGELFASGEDRHLGLYGAFGYDLVFQFEPMPLSLPRPQEGRDLVLYLPDEILVVDHLKEEASLRRYDFAFGAASSLGRCRATAPAPYCMALPSGPRGRADDPGEGEYAKLVEGAKAAFARGDLFEVVLSEVFRALAPLAPGGLFRRLRRSNPAPYGALINLGEGEFLVSASPEMYVRVEGRRVETCPISGTIARGADPIEDCERIRELLNSEKDEAELTMCTDVDRNDKARVCEPGSVRVIGRRQIELYSRVIHTVDHVEGILREPFDALDAFLSHAWAVTVTGAPKTWAIRYIEENERSPRRWYGGAIGRVTFDGNMNTGLTLRTVRLEGGVAEVRAGATLLYASDPEAEEAEVRLKAEAFLAAIRSADVAEARCAEPAPTAAEREVLLIDHEDSFVHTLALYCRAGGAKTVTMRADLAREALLSGIRPDLAILSPGPGRPEDFRMSQTIALLIESGTPIFGVCLGLQGIALQFGGRLGVLETPAHGKPSWVVRRGGRLFQALPRRFSAGRYHSLYAVRSALPPELEVVAETEDGIVMAIEHKSLPIAAVQFHPESLMTHPERIGMPIIRAVLGELCRPPAAQSD